MAKSNKAKNFESLHGLDRQKAYLDTINATDQKSDSLFVTERVTESMRDSGYRDIRRALNDIMDNSLQAGAKKIAILSTSAKEEQKNAREKVSNIAVIDDGHGMYPEMLEIAIKWGGTDRYNLRHGLGRFGFGLPTAAVSVTRIYEVYSKVKNDDWYKVKVDLNEIANKAMSNGGKVAFSPTFEKCTPPEFVKQYIKKQWKVEDLEQGTIVLLISPDRIRSFSLPQTFQNKMLQNIGLTYRHFMPGIGFSVNDKKVEMIDPLFLNPNCLGYDAGNGHLAEGLDEMVIKVRNKLIEDKVVEGNIKLRFSFMHPKFQRKDGKEIPGRLAVMTENNGYFIVCRSGRQIDVVRDSNYPNPNDNKVIINYDRNWAIELNFDPELDELFGITTNKQQVEIDSYLWEIFKENNLPSIVSAFSSKATKLRMQEDVVEEEKKEDNRDSEQIMHDADKFDKLELPREKQDQAEEKLRTDAEEVAKNENADVETVVEKMETEAEKKKFKIEFTDLPGAPFYDIEIWGPQIKIKINTAHRFYIDIYSQQDQRGKTSLELLLFVLGKCESESTGDKLLFYGNERFEWSRKLDLRLKILDKKDPIIDKQSFLEEQK